MALREQHRRFALAYSACLNTAEAARRAGYSKRTARTQGSDLLTKPDIQAAIEQYAANRLKQMEISADRVLKEIARLAFHDPRRVFNADGSIIPVNEWDDDTAAAVAAVEVVEYFEGKGPDKEHVGHIKKIRFWSKNTSLEQLGKHLTLFGKQDEEGRTISELLRAVLLELASRPVHGPDALDAEFQPVPMGRLPAPPDPDPVPAVPPTPPAPPQASW